METLSAEGMDEFSVGGVAGVDSDWEIAINNCNITILL